MLITQITTKSEMHVIYQEPDAGQLDSFVESNPIIKVRLAVFRISLTTEEWNCFLVTGGRLLFHNWIRQRGLEKHMAHPNLFHVESGGVEDYQYFQAQTSIYVDGLTDFFQQAGLNCVAV